MPKAETLLLFYNAKALYMDINGSNLSTLLIHMETLYFYAKAIWRSKQYSSQMKHDL